MEDLDISPVLKWLEKGVRPVGPEVAASQSHNLALLAVLAIPENY